MSWFNFLRHGNALVEIFIEGQNPYAATLLRASDVEAFRDALVPNEAVHGYVVGRVPGADRGVCLLGEQTLCLLGHGRGGCVVRLAHDGLLGFESVKGKYGQTLRAQARSGTHSMYGVSGAMALHFQRALARLSSAAPAPVPFDEQQARHAFGLFQDAAVRLRPAALGEQGGAQWHAWVNQLHQQGLLKAQQRDALLQPSPGA